MKFNLREMFLVVLVIALALGWFLDRRVYYRGYVTYKRISDALHDELESGPPAKQVHIKLTCSGVEKRYGYGGMPLSLEESGER